jgi:hypothetical protein
MLKSDSVNPDGGDPVGVVVRSANGHSHPACARKDVHRRFDPKERTMKRLLFVIVAGVGAVGIAAVPAVAGLAGNPSFSHQLPVPVPSQARVAQFVDDSGHDSSVRSVTATPTATPSTTPAKTRSAHPEPGDDRSRGSREPEPGDDRSRGSREPEPGDDRGRGSATTTAEPGDDRSGHGSGSDDRSGQGSGGDDRSGRGGSSGSGDGGSDG